MTPEDRAERLINLLCFPRKDSPFARLVRDAVTNEIREAEQAMSKYWEMTVGQERDSLKAEIEELRRELRELSQERSNLEWRLYNERL